MLLSVCPSQQVVIAVEWEACIQADASSRLQLLTAEGQEQLVVKFDSLAFSGKSLTKLNIGPSGAALLLGPCPVTAALALLSRYDAVATFPLGRHCTLCERCTCSTAINL